MLPVGKWTGAYLYGRAVMRFYQKRYEDTARLLEKARKLDPNDERKEFSYSYLGRSYMALERYDDALEIMSLAYELFRKRSQSIEDESERSEFIQFIKAFVDLLCKVGQPERAQKVEREVEDIWPGE
jgi:tetratricopeptide (TPR) repeat protein